MRKVGLVAGLLLIGPSVGAQTNTNDVWACVTEKMVGIEERPGKNVVTGDFKVDPERFLLTIEGVPKSRYVRFSPAFAGTLVEENLVGLLSNFKQSNGLAWLIFRSSAGDSSKQPGETERSFRLGYVNGGSQYLMIGRCVAF